MKKTIGIVVPVLALLAVAGCGSSSSDSCDKICSKLIACADSLDTTIATLLSAEETDVNKSNCGTACRDMAKNDCEDFAGYVACVKPLTCPAPSETAIADVQDELMTCQDICQPPR